MKKSALIIIIVMLVLSGCNSKIYYWEFQYSQDNVKEIKIVEAKDEFDYEVIKNLDIELVDDIFQDIQNLEMIKYGTNLKHPSGECFLIVFDNDN